MTNPWEVSESEYQKNLALFGQLTAGQPFMDAVTARNALMRSNLPTQVLSQIWALSDLDKDGRLDIREYSIAMRLALNCLAGMPLPPQLPPSLLVVPARNTPIHHPTMPPAWPGSRHGSVDFSHVGPVGPPERRMSQSQAFPTYPTAPAAIPGAHTTSRHNSISAGSPSSTDRSVFEGRQLDNWAIPHHNRLKYSQLFNALDKDRLGFLTSQVGRSALGLSGLATNVLAHIWFLSDVNKDGKLSVDEYAISQYMIEMFKAGFALPKITPPELVRMCGISSRSANNTPELEPGAEPPQKTPAPKTFEDKRQDNLVKGQAELERRRQILEEEEQRRRAELEKKEREEEAKRERERLEKERQVEAERQAEMERQRQLAAQREEEERKRRAEAERRKEEEEKQRKVQMEKARVKQMQNQKQQENERLAQRQQREKTLQFQLQALDEKAMDIEVDIGKAKDSVAEVTKSIEQMRTGRDEKVARIKELQETNQKTAIESQELGHQLLQKQSFHKETTQRKTELDALRRRRDAMRKAIEDASVELVAEKDKSAKQKEHLTAKKDKYQVECYSRLVAKRDEYRNMLELLAHAQTHAKSKIGEVEEAARAQAPTQNFQDAFAEFDNDQASQRFDSAFGASNSDSDPFGQSAVPGSHDQTAAPAPAIGSRGAVDQSSFNTHDTYKCRALFAFEARSEDELSFEPGDVIIVFQSHAAEPGWRAGQLKEKVGWFPEAFVEAIAAVPQNTSQEPPIPNIPPNVTPSSSLDQIGSVGARAARKAEIARVMGGANVDAKITVPAPPAEVIAQCIAQFQWRARNEEDLSFAKGDVIEVVEKQEMKWKGRNPSGETGWFPKSYVKEMGGTGSPSTTSPAKSAVASPQGVNGGGGGAQYDVVPADLSFAAAADDIYTVIYDFEAVEPTDLPLSVGDTIQVLEKNDEWWKGRCNGKEGIFPANYVEKTAAAQATPTSQAPPTTATTTAAPTVICEAKVIVDFTASAPNQLAIKVGETVKVREKSAAGWWEGELIRDGKPAAGWFPGDYVKVVETTPTSPKTSTTITHPKAIALYDYDASQADELSFKTGDTVVVTDRSEAEWWSGHRAADPSKSGLFPSNYVKIE